VDGITWRFAGDLFNQGITFFVGIVLARLLSPHDYGLLGMITILLVLTQPFINSGFSQALIRKKDCSQGDYSTVFYFNFFIGILMYAILFVVSPYISSFFNEPELIMITRVVGLIIVIDAASLIQNTIISKRLNFKLQTKISFVATVVSGVLGVYLAYNGWGVWSLVYRSIAFHSFKSILLWLGNQWKPSMIIEFGVLKELFGFSSKLLGAALLDKIYNNIYNIVIAKYFSASELGLYTRAKMFKDLASDNIAEVISSVSFPVLSTFQDDIQNLKKNYKTILTSTIFIIFPLMFALSAMSEHIILTLIGEKWKGAIIYLQLLCFVGVFYPVHAMTRSLFYALGRSGLFLKIQIVVKLMAVPAVIVGIIYGIKYMIIAMIVTGAIEYMIKAYYSGKIIGYSMSLQLMDIIPSFLLALFIGGVLVIIDNILNHSSLITLLVEIGVFVFLFFFISELFKLKEYLYIKNTVIEKLSKVKKE
jgi:O-antigen/teichoic acid export membrane protein